ncbi:hypothetical protein KAR91_04395 [Candidatus Pacearchaeota archaeon]|nr:hypothetical protein [Candidatus Pacearchaeota archaeon]
MTARELIKASLRICQVIGHGESVDGESEETDSFTALNSLIASLSTKRLMIHEIVSETHTLVASTTTYTIGSGGDIDTLRPARIVDAFIRDSLNVDHSIEIIGQERYNDISVKSSEGRPHLLFYDTEYPLGKINLYFTPDAAETLHFDSWKPLSQIAAVTDSFVLPLEYERFLKTQVAIDIAPEFGMKLDQRIYEIRDEARDGIKSLNTEPVPLVKLDNALINKGRGYNINNG